MLAQLTIRSFALVDSATLEFERGFNVLTGETGAGKSILIDALTAALGERAGSELVRTGADRATVEAVFEIGDTPFPTVQEWAEDGLVILAREISASGRSTFRINGRMCTASTLREVAADLIDIHGQHDHQSLLHPDRHVEFLDAWAGKEVQALRRRAALDIAEKDLLVTSPLDVVESQVRDPVRHDAGVGAEQQLIGDDHIQGRDQRIQHRAKTAPVSLPEGERAALCHLVDDRVGPVVKHQPVVGGALMERSPWPVS